METGSSPLDSAAERPLAGTVALVTGASSGIGLATARTLSEAGATVAMVARRAALLEEHVGELGRLGHEALAVPADLTDRGEAESAMERVAAELGRIDILVNNAGLMLLGPAAEADPGEWERMVDLNVKGSLYCARAALPHLRSAAAEGPRGVADLVNVSSVAGRVTRADNGVYAATKHAVGAFAESLRQEVTTDRVRVSLVEPGATDTELSSHNRPEIRAKIEARLSGTRRLGPEDVAAAIRFVVTAPPHVGINEILLRSTDQIG